MWCRPNQSQAPQLFSSEEAGASQQQHLIQSPHTRRGLHYCKFSNVVSNRPIDLKMSRVAALLVILEDLIFMLQIEVTSLLSAYYSKLRGKHVEDLDKNIKSSCSVVLRYTKRNNCYTLFDVSFCQTSELLQGDTFCFTQDSEEKEKALYFTTDSNMFHVSWHMCTPS